MFTEDIGDENPVAIYVPGVHPHGYEALSDALVCGPRTPCCGANVLRACLERLGV